ncbi:MAG: TspO/MBR family protein [Beijerinckiaceae bacterium]
MTLPDILGLGGFVLACVATAASGALYPPGAWYETLRKPSWRPPNWLFAPAWTLLYLMIAASGWLVWRKAGFAGAALPLAVYFIHLVINAAWSWLFFGRRRMDLALADVTALWLSIVLMIWLFAPISETAAWLLVPYLAWVSFAAFLNWTMLRLNPAAQGQPAS